jgi:hypothetical protein
MTSVSQSLRRVATRMLRTPDQLMNTGYVSVLHTAETLADSSKPVETGAPTIGGSVVRRSNLRSRRGTFTNGRLPRCGERSPPSWSGIPRYLHVRPIPSRILFSVFGISAVALGVDHRAKRFPSSWHPCLYCSLLQASRLPDCRALGRLRDHAVEVRLWGSAPPKTAGHGPGTFSGTPRGSNGTTAPAVSIALAASPDRARERE